MSAARVLSPAAVKRSRHAPCAGYVRRGGLTLVELLVVISILMLLVMVAMPALSPTKDSRQLREAARAVDLFFGASRNQALATGRACGVLLERLPARLEACVTIYPVEEPAPYAGEYLDSKVLVMHRTDGTAPDGRTPATYVRVQGIRSGTIMPRMVRQFDRIQFNQQGPLYVINSGTRQSDGSLTDPFDVYLERPDSGRCPWTTRATEATFRIFRQPMRTSGDPLELPAGTAIDLFLSRVESDYYFRLDDAQRRSSAGAADNTPVIIMFSPHGGVDVVYHARTRDSSRQPIVRWDAPVTTIGLLVGQRGRILGLDTNGTPVRPADNVLNDGDRRNYWVTISPRTGLTAAKELASGLGGIAAGGR